MKKITIIAPDEYPLSALFGDTEKKRQRHHRHQRSNRLGVALVVYHIHGSGDQHH